MNGQEQTILQLWNEGLTISTIALKTGIDEDEVADVVEDPTHYISERELLKVAGRK